MTVRPAGLHVLLPLPRRVHSELGERSQLCPVELVAAGLQVSVPDPRTVLGAVGRHLDHRARGQDAFPCNVLREGGQARLERRLGLGRTALRWYGRLGGLYAERSKSFLLLSRQLRPGAGLPSQPSSEIIAVEEDCGLDRREQAAASVSASWARTRWWRCRSSGQGLRAGAGPLVFTESTGTSEVCHQLPDRDLLAVLARGGVCQGAREPMARW